MMMVTCVTDGFEGSLTFQDEDDGGKIQHINFNSSEEAVVHLATNRGLVHFSVFSAVDSSCSFALNVTPCLVP